MTWKKLLTAMTALAAMLVVFAASPPSFARELQRLETATPEQLGMSSARLERIAEALKKEVSDGKLPGAVVIVARKGKIVYSGATGFPGQGCQQADGGEFDFPYLFDDQAACFGGGDDAG